MKLFGFFMKGFEMNVFVLLTCFVLSYILVVSLLWVGDREAEWYFYPSCLFRLKDGTCRVVFCNGCVIAYLDCGAYQFEKLAYDGEASTIFVDRHTAKWRYELLNECAVVLSRTGETRPYFLNMKKDLTGKWETSISRF